MNSFGAIGPVLRQYAFVLPALALWVLLLLSLSAGEPHEILDPSDHQRFFDALRSLLPFLAASIGLIILLVKRSRRTPGRRFFFGPLGLAALYGLAGLTATYFSPEPGVALYWAGVYISVPLVLWAVVWGSDSLYMARFFVNFNLVIVMVLVGILFASAVLYLDLGTIISTPSIWPECKLNRQWHGASWLELSSGTLRPTGVGRYAAIAAIVALGGMLQGRWRFAWAVTFLASFALLLTSGARGSFIGFAAAAPLVIVLHGWKRAVVVGGVLILVLTPLALATDVDEKFIGSCITRGRLRAAPPVEPPTKSSQGQAIAQQVEAQKDGPTENPTSEKSAAPAEATETTSRRDAVAETPVPAEISNRGQPATSGPGARAVPQLPSQTESGPAPAVKGESAKSLAGSAPASTVTGEPATPATGSVPAPAVGEESANPRPAFLERPSPQEPTASETVKPVAPAKPSSRTSQDFFSFTGRRAVWVEGWKIFNLSPWLGAGFHADRLFLRTHMHNAVMHSLIQTGVLGTIPFLGAFIFTWYLFIENVRRLSHLPEVHRHLIIQSGGILAFLTLRGLPESTGAFFGVDWLLLAPLLLYLQVAHNFSNRAEESSSTPRGGTQPGLASDASGS